ncbi:MAG: DUF2855 family protein [Pseudomonadota bacterium]
MQVFEVQKSDITNGHLHDAPSEHLPEGGVRLRLRNFALTANNVTYAATGDAIGYWSFFPTPTPAAGRVPVWGIAEVVETATEIPVGERVFGFFPMAEEMIAQPGRIRERAWTDAASHRAALPAVYNEYFRLAAIPSHEPALDDLMGLLYPLYATSFVLADYLSDNDWFGAEQIVVASASSKTAIGMMQLIAEMPGAPAITALTSSRNVTFVEGLGVADKVLTYTSIGEKLPKRPSVYVDMSGNVEVRRAVHETLMQSLAKSIAVGLSHWDKFEQGVELPGPQAEFFFAPAQVKKRREEWGPGVVEGKIMAAWHRLASTRTDWLHMVPHQGLDAAATVYTDLAAGRTDPSEGHVVTLS